MNTADQAASGPRRAFDPAILGAAWPPIDGNYRTCPVTAEIVARAASAGYPQWWAKAGSVGYCTRPVHLVGRGPGGTRLSVLARCKNRRGAVCPSCSDLYRGDTWHLVHPARPASPSLVSRTLFRRIQRCLPPSPLPASGPCTRATRMWPVPRVAATLTKPDNSVGTVNR
jgi:hypothetical protein